MRRISIRSLMAFVVVSAVGLAALKNASVFWAVGVLLADILAIGVAVLGAAFSRGREQAWWAGFALFSCGYLAFLIGLWSDFALHSQTVTIPVVQYAYDRINPHAALQAAKRREARLSGATPLPRPITPAFGEFQRMAHAVLAPLCGLIGGMTAAWFYARRERDEAAAA
jgi:hypothetical protein